MGEIIIVAQYIMSIRGSATLSGTGKLVFVVYPTAPTNLSASSITTTSAVIGFTPPPASANVTNYYAYNNGVFFGNYTGTNSITLTGLTATTSYVITLVAVNSVGVSPVSASVSFTANDSFGLSYSTINIPTSTYSSIGVSSTGQYQSAVINNGYIYTSSNYGQNWGAATSTAAYWKSICLSSTGQYQTAVASNGTSSTGIYISSNYGANWTSITTTPTNIAWFNVSMSSSGQYQLITPGIVGNFNANQGSYGSSDYGNTWALSLAHNVYSGCGCSSMSSTGQFQVVVSYSGGTGKVYISNTYGSTWNNYKSLGTVFLNSVSVSSSGQYILLACGNYSSGSVYTSSDYGANFSAVSSIGSILAVNACVSETGKYQVVSGDGYVFYSSDFGATWTKCTTIPTYATANSGYTALSYNSKYLISSGKSGGKIYISTY